MKSLRVCVILFLALTVSAVAQAQTFVFSNSPVQISAEDGRLGMIVEPTVATDEETMTLKAGDTFVLTAGTLTTNGRLFDGKLVVALMRGNTLIDIMAKITLRLSSNNLPLAYLNCCVSDGVEVREGDMIRLLTTEDEENYSYVGSSYSYPANYQIPAVNHVWPFVKINLPLDIPGATVRFGDTTLWPDKVIKGRNFYFYITPDEADALVIVKVNGMVFTPSNEGMYSLVGVTEECDIDVKVYNSDAVFPYKVVEISEEVRTEDLLTEAEMDCLKGLKVKGPLKEGDFTLFREKMYSLEILDLTEAVFENNYVPESAFSMNTTIKEIKLPETLEGSYSNAFYFMEKLEFIVLPSKMNVFGFNEFFGCASLKTVWVKWSPIEHDMKPLLGFPIPPCAFRATTYDSDGTLIVPEGCVEAYRNTDVWGNFKTIREKLPIDFKLERPFERFLPKEDALQEVKSESAVQVMPGSGGCWIVTEDGTERPVVIYDLAGREVHCSKVAGSREFVSLPAGCYVIRVGSESHKVMVAR